MTRRTFISRDVQAGCFVCHGDEAHWLAPNAQAIAARHHDATGHQTWCNVYMALRYGANAADPRQADIEEAIASASSGGRPDAAPLTDPDASTVVPADVSAPQGRPVETPAPMRRGARGRKPETVS